MDKTYRINKTVNTYEVTPGSVMSPIIPLNYFQEAAQRQIEDVGLGLEFMKDHKLAWILVKYEITYNHYPKAEEQVIVETEPMGLNRFEASRRFEILSKDGEVLISGKSIWMLADIESGKIRRISDVEGIGDYFSDTKNVIFRIPRLERVDDFDDQLEFKVRYLDIDINQHVNNSKYLAWAFEILPMDVVQEYEIHKVTIIYKEQSFYGEIVTVKAKEISPHVWRINIVNKDNKVLSEIKIELRKKLETEE